MKINIQNDKKINAALRAVNGRSAAFCYTDASELRALAQQADNTLNKRGVRKKNAPGTELTARMAGPYANRYRYSANANSVTLVRSSTAWFLTDIGMEMVYPREKELFEMKVRPSAVADIVTHAMANITMTDE